MMNLTPQSAGATAQQLANVGTRAPQPPHFDAHANELEGALAHLGELLVRLEGRAARLMGPTPESASAQPSGMLTGKYEPVSVLDRLNGGVEHLRGLLKRLHEVTERLELL